jgi:hypothetical protein
MTRRVESLRREFGHASISPVGILRSEFSRWLLLSLAVAAFGVLGIMRAPSTDTATVGDIAGFGFRMDGKQCYLTVTYTVRGSSFRFQSSHEQRWCDYQPLYRQEGSVVVYYDSTNPETATLTPRGTTPMAAVIIGLTGVAACCALQMRRSRRRSELQRPSAVSAVPTL